MKKYEYPAGTIIGWKEDAFGVKMLFTLDCNRSPKPLSLELNSLKANNFELYIGVKKISADMIRPL